MTCSETRSTITPAPCSLQCRGSIPNGRPRDAGTGCSGAARPTTPHYECHRPPITAAAKGRGIHELRSITHMQHRFRAYWSENRHWPSPGPKPTDRIELVAERGTDPSPPLDAVGITGRDNGTAGQLGSAREQTPSPHHTRHRSISKGNPGQCRLHLPSPP